MSSEECVSGSKESDVVIGKGHSSQLEGTTLVKSETTKMHRNNDTNDGKNTHSVSLKIKGQSKKQQTFI